MNEFHLILSNPHFACRLKRQARLVKLHSTTARITNICIDLIKNSTQKLDHYSNEGNIVSWKADLDKGVLPMISMRLSCVEVGSTTAKFVAELLMGGRPVDIVTSTFEYNIALDSGRGLLSQFPLKRNYEQVLKKAPFVFQKYGKLSVVTTNKETYLFYAHNCRLNGTMLELAKQTVLTELVNRPAGKELRDTSRINKDDQAIELCAWVVGHTVHQILKLSGISKWDDVTRLDTYNTEKEIELELLRLGVLASIVQIVTLGYEKSIEKIKLTSRLRKLSKPLLHLRSICEDYARDLYQNASKLSIQGAAYSYLERFKTIPFQLLKRDKCKEVIKHYWRDKLKRGDKFDEVRAGLQIIIANSYDITNKLKKDWVKLHLEWQYFDYLHRFSNQIVHKEWLNKLRKRFTSIHTNPPKSAAPTRQVSRRRQLSIIPQDDYNKKGALITQTVYPGLKISTEGSSVVLLDEVTGQQHLIDLHMYYSKIRVIYFDGGKKTALLSMEMFAYSYTFNRADIWFLTAGKDGGYNITNMCKVNDGKSSLKKCVPGSAVLVGKDKLFCMDVDNKSQINMCIYNLDLQTLETTLKISIPLHAWLQIKETSLTPRLEPWKEALSAKYGRIASSKSQENKVVSPWIKFMSSSSHSIKCFEFQEDKLGGMLCLNKNAFTISSSKSVGVIGFSTSCPLSEDSTGRKAGRQYSSTGIVVEDVKTCVMLHKCNVVYAVMIVENPVGYKILALRRGRIVIEGSGSPVYWVGKLPIATTTGAFVWCLEDKPIDGENVQEKIPLLSVTEYSLKL